MLDLSGSQLVVIPDTICMLPRLEYLNLSNNQLTGLPSGMRGLECSLELLDLQGNGIVPNGDGCWA